MLPDPSKNSQDQNDELSNLRFKFSFNINSHAPADLPKSVLRESNANILDFLESAVPSVEFIYGDITDTLKPKDSNATIGSDCDRQVRVTKMHAYFSENDYINFVNATKFLGNVGTAEIKSYAKEFLLARLVDFQKQQAAFKEKIDICNRNNLFATIFITFNLGFSIFFACLAHINTQASAKTDYLNAALMSICGFFAGAIFGNRRDNILKIKDLRARCAASSEDIINITEKKVK